MSYAPSTLTACPDIQAELINYYETCAAANLREPMPFFDFLFSDFNQRGYSQLVAPGGGKLKTVYLRYDQRILESETTAPDGTALDCASTTKRGDLTHSCTIDPVTDTVQIDELMTAADFMYACRDNGQIVAGKIQRLIDVLVRRTASKLTTQAATLLGGWNDNVTPQVADGGYNYLKVNTLKASSTDINPTAFEDVDFAIQQSMWCGQVAIFGGSTFYKYARVMNAGCCSTQGIDLSQIMGQYGKAVMYDSKVQVAAGQDKAWALQAGSLAPVYFTFNDNGLSEGAGVQYGANYIKSVVRDPQSGLPIDLTISDACGSVSIIARSCAKLCALPTDLYGTGDPQEGVTGFAGIKVVNV